MATIKDVAQMAGVSIATVSNYLNQTKPVSKEASTAIQKAVDVLHYSLNLSAKNLKSNTYSDIGVILPNFDDSYYVQIFQGIENAFQNTKYYTNLAFSYDIPENEQNIINHFLKKQICGLLLVSCQQDNWKFFYDRFNSNKHPLVLIDRAIPNLDANFVAFNDHAMIQEITMGLLNDGYRNIHLVSGPNKFTCEANCISGFVNAFRTYNLQPDPSLLIQTNLSKEDAFRKTIQLLRTTTPEAIVATSETLATGVIEALIILNYNIDKIPVLTLGQEHWNLYTRSFSSNSFMRPAIQLGQTAAALLLDQLEAPMTKENEKIILSDISISNYKIVQHPISRKNVGYDATSQKSIRILMLDTPQVHSLLGLLKNFENQTGLKTEVTLLPHRNLYDEILKNHTSESGPLYDIIMYDISWGSTLAAEHILEDITPHLTEIDLNSFLPDCLKYFSHYHQRYYGLPFIYSPQIFYYRKDLFENSKLKAEYEKKNNITLRPPLTLKEFNTLADFFTNHTDAIDYGISIPAAYDECLAPEIYMRLRAFGCDLFDSNGNVSLDPDAALMAYISLVRSCRLAKPNYRAATDQCAVQDFLNGETAMLITYSTFLADVADLRKNSVTGTIGYHHIPGRSPLLGGWSLGISSRSERKQESFSFLKWLCDEQIANYYSLLGGQTAITSTYTNDELLKLYPWLSLYHSTYKYTKYIAPPDLGNNTIVSQNEIDAIVCKWFYELLDDKIEVQEAIVNTRIELEQLVERYRHSS